jgi:hypothetical protein
VVIRHYTVGSLEKKKKGIRENRKEKDRRKKRGEGKKQ